jgi:hypothetical protein
MSLLVGWCFEINQGFSFGILEATFGWTILFRVVRCLAEILPPHGAFLGRKFVME